MRRVGRIGTVALALALVLALLPAHAMAATTWDVATAVDLGNALASAADGDTIRLTDDIYYNSTITLNGISLTLDVGSHTLDVSTPGMALYVTAGAVLELESDGGAFNVTGSIGVLAEAAAPRSPAPRRPARTASGCTARMPQTAAASQRAASRRPARTASERMPMEAP